MQLYTLLSLFTLISNSESSQIPQNLKWVSPPSIWSQLQFPNLPPSHPNILEDRLRVPQKFNSNFTVSKDGYVTGEKFCQCGRSPYRFNSPSDDLQKNDIPWTALLVLNKQESVFCGGALVNDRMVITASHCVAKMKADEISVTISDEDYLPSSSTIYSASKYEVSKIIIYPNYNKKTIEHDIALLVLREPIDFFVTPISPVCLPIQNDMYYKKYSSATVTQWVSTLDSRANVSSDTLQKANLELISVKECEKMYFNSGLVSEYHVCTKWCQGDHGGQLLVEKNERKILIGVGSWGLNCFHRSDSPSVFTRVAKYAGWILEQSKNNSAEYCIE